MGHPNYWGKTSPDSQAIRPLRCHCIDAAAVFHVIWSTEPSVAKRLGAVAGVDADSLESMLLFLVALHDLGKFSLGFQWRAPSIARALQLPIPRVAKKLNHVDAGWWLWDRHLANHFAKVPRQGAAALAAPWAAPLVQAVLGHHGGPVNHDEDLRRAFGDSATADALQFSDELEELFLTGRTVPALEDGSARRLSWLFAGLVVLADWIASDQRFFPADQAPTPLFALDLAEYYERHAWPRAHEAVSASGITRPGPATSDGFHSLFPDMPADADPRPLQSYALGNAVLGGGPELHIFEDLTGNGKTEAALACAHRLMRAGSADGLYFALPTMATANAMYSRLGRTYTAFFTQKPSLALAHGARHLVKAFLASIPLEDMPAALASHSEASEAFCTRWLADNKKKALLAPCGVGTLDQALLGSLSARHQSLRLLGLARSVLIADEVHGYDAYTLRLLEGLLTFQAALGGSAILLSATLPLKVRTKLIEAWRVGRGLEPEAVPQGPFPLATRVTDTGFHAEHEAVLSDRRLDVAVELVHDPGEIVRRLGAAAEAGACACWVRNTVDDAVQAWRDLRKEFERLGLDPGNVLLHHARFVLGERLKTEEEVLSTFGKDSAAVRGGKIVVGSQVLEQSLDYDVDLMASDLAPMDALIQRAGRCHRHELERPRGFERARLLVLSPEPMPDAPPDWYAKASPLARYVYRMPCLLWRTARLLAGEGAIRLPEKARSLVEGAYNEGEDDPQALLAQDEQEWAGDKGKESLAGYNLLDVGCGYGKEASMHGWDSEERAPTRLGEATVQVRLLKATENGLTLYGGGLPGDPLACALSEVRVYAHRAAQAVVPQGLKEEVDRMKDAMRDKGEGALILPLTPSGKEWLGRVMDGKGRELPVRYGAAGFVIEKAERPDIG